MGTSQAGERPTTSVRPAGTVTAWLPLAAISFKPRRKARSLHAGRPTQPPADKKLPGHRKDVTEPRPPQLPTLPESQRAKPDYVPAAFPRPGRVRPVTPVIY